MYEKSSESWALPCFFLPEGAGVARNGRNQKKINAGVTGCIMNGAWNDRPAGQLEAAMLFTKALTWILLFVLTQAALNAADAPAARITWDDFSRRVTPERTVRMVLPDGTNVEGYVLQAKPDAIDIYVTHTSNKQAHPKGNATISRESLSVVQVRSPRHIGKLIGTLAPIGVGAAIAAAGIAGNQGSDSVYGYALAGGLTIAIGAPVGFLAGRAVDRRFDQFVIIPEPHSRKQ